MILHRYTNADLEKYLANDSVLAQLEQLSDYQNFATHNWLVSMPAKRMIYQDVYGELFESSGKSVLDVGGGFSGLSTVFAKNHDYTLLDIMAHNHEDIERTAANVDMKWVQTDWFAFTPEKQYDYIIANDLFPNVDQRLAMFVKKFKPFAKQLIITLTCYEADRFYITKRVDAEEVLTMKAWNWGMTRYALSEVLPETLSNLPVSFPAQTEPYLFANGRDVYKIVV